MSESKEDARIEALRKIAALPDRADHNQMTRADEALQRKIGQKRHAILCGPPGTGKTKLVLDLKDKLFKEGKLGIWQMVQFHPQYSYQDFVDGYKPTKDGFIEQQGSFRNFLDAVEKNDFSNKDQSSITNLFIIDEINRADVSSVFGEILTLLDDSDQKEVITARSQKPLKLFKSVVIVGTMNTADKTIALMDFALRRRFSFIFVAPDYDGLKSWLNQNGFAFDDFTIDKYVQAISILNTRIAAHPLLGKGMTLGQSFFVPTKSDKAPFTIAEITDCFVEQVLPQLEAYLGFGAQHELDKIIGVELRKYVETGIRLTEQDVIGLINVLSDANA